MYINAGKMLRWTDICVKYLSNNEESIVCINKFYKKLEDTTLETEESEDWRIFKRIVGAV